MPGNRLDVTADWYTRVGDTAAQMTATLKDGAGAAVDLTGGSVNLKAYGPGADLDVSCTLADAANGVVTVIPTFTELGTYYGRFVATLSGGGVYTFPTDRELEIVVKGPE